MKRLILVLLLGLACSPVSADFGVNQLIGFGAVERRPSGAPYGTDLITGSEIYSSDDETLGDADNGGNENTGDFWSTNNFTSAVANGRYWRAQFSTAKFVTKVTLENFVADADAGTVLKVEGSNDGSSFTEIFSQAGLVTPNASLVTAEFSNSTAYLYYQVRFVRDATNGIIRVQNFHMFESI